MYSANEEEVKKRWGFEDKVDICLLCKIHLRCKFDIKFSHIFFILIQIKRPYFHVKPLEQDQLANWREYLDFEIEQGDQNRIRILFERCLIACALYEEFWLKVNIPCNIKFIVLLDNQNANLTTS